MKRRSTACPACGAPVEFQVGSSLIAICEFCQSAVARTDKKIEDFGKVADLVETDSPLRRGMSGRFRGKHFDILGRVQYRHPAGGVWNEWYLLFSGDKWGWLAEAQGRWFLMFQRRIPSSANLPEFGSVEVGQSIQLGSRQFTVNEVGTGTAASAEGDIPWQFVPGQEHRFVDLGGSDGVLASLEYGEEHHAYVGKEVKLDDLKLDELPPEAVQATVVPGQQLNCPQCGGPLSLHVPDQCERVTCGNCNALLDVSSGKLEYFKTLKTSERMPILIPLGSEGELGGTRYTVIGFLRRYALYEGRTYPWSEYLLYNSAVGFRWLIHNDSHWSFGEPLTLNQGSSGRSVKYDRTDFRIYDRGKAYVKNVMGEFYWKVNVGDKVATADYIAPPRMISFEASRSGNSKELNATLSTYLTPETVEKAFGVGHTGRSWGIGVIQPRPAIGIGVFLMWPIFVVLIAVIHAIFDAFAKTKSPDPTMAFYAILFVSIIPVCALIFMYAYEAKRWEDSDYSPYRSSE